MAEQYMMRHGQTFFNLQHKIQGWRDTHLKLQKGTAAINAAAP